MKRILVVATSEFRHWSGQFFIGLLMMPVLVGRSIASSFAAKQGPRGRLYVIDHVRALRAAGGAE
jgi:hypothetical protein